MLVALPAPVLSVAADAVRDLDGGEALPGLWTLFTKCKESLRDGRRLENMCWRLWYREMMISSGDRYEYTLDSNSEKWFIEADDRAYRPPTPEEVALASQSNGLAPVQAPQMTDRLTCVASIRPTATRRLSSVSLMKKAKPISTGVGKIICDLLPQSLPPPEELRRAVSSWRKAYAASAMPPSETCPLKYDQPPSDVDAKRSSLPTSSTDNNKHRALPQSNENFPEGPTSPDLVDSSPMQLLEAQDPSGSEVPALTIVDTSSPPAPLIAASNLIHASPESSLRDPVPSLNTTLIAPPGLTQPPPRLIIVNPTPNPTPHPTPPATPVLSSASSLFILTTGVHVTVPSGNQHLIPPPLFHMAPVLPVVCGLESEQSLIVQGDTSTADVAHTLITSVAEAGAPRMQREELQVPPSPALTEEALVPPQHETKTMNPIDREQLHHPLTIQTKIGTVTSKRSNFLRLVPSSPSVIAHIFGESPAVQDVTVSPTKSIFSSPTKDTASIESPSKKSGKGSPRPREPVRRQSSGGGKPTSSTKKMSRANSTGNVVIAPTTSSGTQSRSGSRSRSRESHGPGLGLGGGALTMTRTTSAGGTTRSRSKAAVATRVGARLGARRAADRERERSKSKDKIEEKDDDDDTLKRPTFNIGSNSDEGSGIGSKSVGSGSEVSGAVAPVAIAVMLSKVKEEEVKVVEEEADIKMVVGETQIIAEEEALLPQQQQRRIVLATSESDEYETESDEWSSEDMSADEAEVVKSGGNNAQRPKAQMQPQQPHPQPQPPPPPPPPTQQHRAGAHAHVDEANRHKHLPTHHHPPHHPHAHHIEKLSQLVRNAKRQSVNHGKAHVQSIEQAALEAQRQREMFAKIPPSNNLARTTSVGLLTQLMNPDPQIFPPNHPYRRGLSTGEIRGGQGHIRLHAGLTMTGAVGPAQPNLTQFQAQRPTQPHQPAHRNSQEQGQGTLAPPVATAPTEVRRHVSAPQQHPGAPGTGTLAPSLKPSKSSAAGPIASQVLVGSVRSNAGVSENGVLNSSPGVSKQGHHPHVRSSSGYRPRARPQDAELEEESESEDERAIQLSKSVAQEKLRALAERRGIRPNRRASTDDEPAWAQRHEQQHHQHHQRHHSHLQPPPGPVRMHTSPSPIPQVLSHPYNLPLTALPTTPRTTRLHMMQTEMSESLRRNLLWERRVSKNNILGFRRTASTGGGAQGNVINGLRPLTTNEPPNVVHLSAKGTANHNVNGNAGGAVPAAAAGGAGQESNTRAFARNRSWAANDYHYAGW